MFCRENNTEKTSYDPPLGLPYSWGEFTPHLAYCVLGDDPYRKMICRTMAFSWMFQGDIDGKSHPSPISDAARLKGDMFAEHHRAEIAGQTSSKAHRDLPSRHRRQRRRQSCRMKRCCWMDPKPSQIQYRYRHLYNIFFLL